MWLKIIAQPPGDIMKYNEIIDKLNKKNVSKVKLVMKDGNEITLSKKDSLEKDDGILMINRNNEDISISLDEIDEIISIPKLQIISFQRPGQRNRH